VRLGKEAACLRVVGSRNPDPAIAALEDELTALGRLRAPRPAAARRPRRAPAAAVAKG
jgi:hypothetical protein